VGDVVRWETREAINEAMDDYERDVMRALTVGAYRAYIKADEEATVDANKDDMHEGGAGAPTGKGAKPDYKTRVDPKQWMVIDSAAANYIAEYRRLLTEKGATLINGQEVPWLQHFSYEARSEVTNILERGIHEGIGSRELGKELASVFGNSRAKATTVARTETAQIRGNAKAKRWKERGYSVVRITDGRSPGHFPCNCEQYDGQYWTVEYYHSHITEHPNCTRAASPVRPDSIPPGTFVWGLSGGEIPKVEG